MVTFQNVREKEKNLLRSHGANESEIGLALSGGGIRSATFSLGVLQYLAKQKWLRKVDYMSTVSGGGYIGAWLSALVYRKRLEIESQDNQSETDTGGRQQTLQKRLWDEVEKEVANPQSEPVHWIRNHANYITPLTGLSADTFSTVGLVVTNLFLSIAIVCTITSVIALLAVSVGSIFGYLAQALAKPPPTDALSWWPSWLQLSYLPWLISGLFFFAGMIALRGTNVQIGNLFHPEVSDGTEGARPRGPLILAGLCLILFQASFSVVTTYAISSECGWPSLLPDKTHICVNGTLPHPMRVYLEVAVMWGFLYLFGTLGVVLYAWNELWQGGGYWRDEIVGNKILTALGVPTKHWISGAIGGLVIVVLSEWVRGTVASQLWIASILGVVITITGVTVALSIHMMLIGRELPQIIREMWHRVVGWIVAGTIVWVGLLGTTVLAPALFHPRSLEWLQVGVIITWLGSSVAGGLLAFGRYIGAKSEGHFGRLTLWIAPPMFVAGLVLLLFDLILRLRFPKLADPDGCSSLATCIQYAATTLTKDKSFFPEFVTTLTLCVSLAVLLLIWSFYYNVNWHSLYHLYHDRLVRCFLGASNRHRRRTLVRFDPNDDLPLSVLAQQRPFHIFCTALNLTGSRDLSWQTRKATSFFFTPLDCGYVLPKAKRVVEKNAQTIEYVDIEGFVETKSYMTPRNAENTREPWRTQATVGTAMTISGAAMTPSCGYHTNAMVAFLMAVFNARLGRWCPNPMNGAAHNLARRADPRFGIWWFVKESLGWTNEKSAFVFLSDGGHFENTGLYELVRRRCSHIILVDAECDANLAFEGLTEAVRKCRLDLDAEIDINLSLIRPDAKDGVSPQSYAEGTITYHATSSKKDTGTLVYLKLSMPSPNKGGLPIDVLGYKAAHERFPYERTSDQWFDENQFESYRKLGNVVAHQAFEGTKLADRVFGDAGRLESGRAK